jgi:hypothetical protein
MKELRRHPKWGVQLEVPLTLMTQGGALGMGEVKWPHQCVVCGGEPADWHFYRFDVGQNVSQRVKRTYHISMPIPYCKKHHVELTEWDSGKVGLDHHYREAVGVDIHCADNDEAGERGTVFRFRFYNREYAERFEERNAKWRAHPWFGKDRETREAHWYPTPRKTREKVAPVLDQGDDLRRGAAGAQGSEETDTSMDEAQVEELAERHDMEGLIAALTERNMDVRRMAAEALGDIGEGWAVVPLISALNDTTDYPVVKEPLRVPSTPIDARVEAALALGRIGNDEAIEALEGVDDASAKKGVYRGLTLGEAIEKALAAK